MAQADSTKAIKLAYLHMVIVRRVTQCLLQVIITQQNPQHTLYQFIAENADRIFATQFGRRHFELLSSRQVTTDELPLYLVEFLICHLSNCAVVPQTITDALQNLNQMRKELHTESVIGIGDTFFTGHMERVKRLVTFLCEFLNNEQLTSGIQEEIANMLQPNFDHSDAVMEEYNQHQAHEKSHRNTIHSFTNEQLELHRMLRENVVSIREADERGHQSDQKALPARPEKYPIKVPETVIEMALQINNDRGAEHIARDLANIVNNQDAEIRSTTLRENANSIRAAFRESFSFAELYARQGCIQLCVTPNTIEHLLELLEECVSGELTKKLKPVEDIIRRIPNFENYKQDAVLYQDHYDSVMKNIASQMGQIFNKRGLTSPNESPCPKVAISSDGTLVVSVICPSIQERDKYETAIKTGKFNDCLKTLENNLRTVYAAPDMVLTTTVVEKSNDISQDAGTREVVQTRFNWANYFFEKLEQMILLVWEYMTSPFI